MWYLIVFYISIFLLLVNPKVEDFWWKYLAITNLLFIGILGTVPFFLNEFGSVSFLITLRIVTFLSVVIALLKFVINNQVYYLFKINFDKNSKMGIFSFILVAIVFVRGLLMPVSGWDAYAMYDGRARYLAEGMKFKDLGNLTKYDDTNYLYYFGYPPSTSVVHATIYSADVNTPMFIYSMFYISLAIFSILIIKKIKIPLKSKILFIFLAVGSKYLLEPITSAYTNLPMISFLIASLYFSLEYSKNSNISNIVYAVIMMVFASWTRILEPLFVALFIPLFILVLNDTKKSFIQKIVILFVSSVLVVSPRFFWSGYVTAVVGNIEGNMPSISFLIDKIINSLSVDNIIEVAFFVYTSLHPIKLYIGILLTVLIYLYIFKLRIGKSLIIILSVVFITLLIMISGTFYLSATFDWWNTIPGSFLRSNLILLPLISFCAAYVYEAVLNNNVKK